MTRIAPDLTKETNLAQVWQKYIIPEQGGIAEQLFRLEPMAPALLLSATEYKQTHKMEFKVAGIGFQHFQAFFSSYTFDGSVLEIFIS